MIESATTSVDLTASEPRAVDHDEVGLRGASSAAGHRTSGEAVGPFLEAALALGELG